MTWRFSIGVKGETQTVVGTANTTPAILPFSRESVNLPQTLDFDLYRDEDYGRCCAPDGRGNETGRKK
jgi:hypothetical protein